MENATAEAAIKEPAQQEVGERILKRNLFMFPLGTLGRDFLYNFFNNYLLTFILLTKNLSKSQLGAITIIIVCARIFDALNDPIMGGIVENTRTKWGKYKPWQLIGSVLTGGVVIALFMVDLYGWAFIGFLAFVYFMFSITFTMNDISYWGMMPTLTSNANDRNLLTSFTQIICSAGGGLAGFLVPILTTGVVGAKIFGSAVTAYRVIAVATAVLMVGFQLFTILGVKEKPLPVNFEKTKRMSFKELFKVIIKNDQLLWCALVLLIFNIGTNVVFGGLSTFYIYFEFGYEGFLITAFGIGFSILSVLFTLLYPILSKKFGRDKILYSTGIAIIVGYVLMMIVGLAIPTSPMSSVLGKAKFALITILYSFAGWGSGFYMIMVINIANTVEYNEYKTGKREEGLIFSMRPLTAKFGSALMQGLVSLVLIIANVTKYTNMISDLENAAASGAITPELKLEQINAVIANVPEKSRMLLLVFMCMIPAVFLAVALIIYKKKCFLNEKTLAEMVAVTEQRKKEAEALEAAGNAENAGIAIERTTFEDGGLSFENGKIEDIEDGENAESDNADGETAEDNAETESNGGGEEIAESVEKTEPSVENEELGADDVGTDNKD